MLGVIGTDYWGNYFCYHHNQEYPRCFSCQRLVTPQFTRGGLTYPDGRVICNLCRKSEVVKPEKARMVADRVKYTLERQGFDFSRFSVPLRFMQQDELIRAHAVFSSQKPTGLTRTVSCVLGNHIVSKTVEEIIILYGLPEEHTASILAHELGHAWLVFEHFPELDSVIEEGFCELVDYLWLSAQNTVEAEFRIHIKMENQDPVYGAGFRQAYHFYRMVGFKNITKHLKQYGRYVQ